MKVIQKYFLALVPPLDILEKAHDIKLLIRDQFGIKYALKSPPHITVKMPFNYNEAKETQLERELQEFLQTQKPFPIKITGTGNFGNRVIYLSIEETAELRRFQSELKTFCKKELNLIDELSDRNFHPHLTIAFKDLKPKNFEEVLLLVKKESLRVEFYVGHLVLLKRVNGKWIFFKNLFFGYDT